MPDWPTLSRLILAHIPLHRRNVLHSLLLTSKSFYTAAEPLVYHHIIFTDVRRVILFATSLSDNPRLAGLVHTFGINLSELRMRAQVHRHDALNVQTALRREFWEAVKAILGAMTALDSLVMAQIPGMKMNFTWILDDELLPFTLKEIKLHLAFDNHIARFLNMQGVKGKLRTLQVYNMVVPKANEALLNLDPTADIVDDNGGGVGIEDIRLPDIDALDISLSITPHISLAGPHLAHLQIYVDVQVTATSVFTDTLTHFLSPGRKLLRGLSLIDVPASLSTCLLSQITNSSVFSSLTSTLSHLSHFHLPCPYTAQSSTTPTRTRTRTRSRTSHQLNARENQMTPRSMEQSTTTAPSAINEKLEFLHSLTSFHSLHSLELSLNSWDFFDTSHTTIHNFTYYHLHPQQVPPPPPLSHHPPNSSSTPDRIPSPVTQKILLSELKMYCPSLRIVVFWLDKIRFRWKYVIDDDCYPDAEKMEVLYTGMVPSWEKEDEDDVDVDVAVIGDGRAEGHDDDDDVNACGRVEEDDESGGGGTGKGRGGSSTKCGTVGQMAGTGSSTSASANASDDGGGGGGGGGTVDCEPKLQNAVIPGEWHCRMDTNQWPALSTLWSRS